MEWFLPHTVRSALFCSRPSSPVVTYGAQSPRFEYDQATIGIAPSRHPDQLQPHRQKCCGYVAADFEKAQAVPQQKKHAPDNWLKLLWAKLGIDRSKNMSRTGAFFFNGTKKWRTLSLRTALTLN
jgi:hypothetical protein